MSAGSLIATNRLQAAIQLSGIEDCAALDIEDGDFGEVEFGSGEPLSKEECQNFLDWCDTDNNWTVAEGKCLEYGFTGETLQNCIDMCNDLMGYQIEVQINNSRTVGVCIACGPGEYYDTTTQACKSCSAGTYRGGVTRHLFETCGTCKAGTYSMIGATECTKCSAGWTSTAGSGLCIRCLKGTYAPIAGSPECLVCEDGTYSDTLGASSCTSCPADVNGLTPHSLHTSLQGGLVEPEYGQTYSRDSINSCYTGKNTPMNDAVGTYEWIDNCFYGVF